jgi:hypothetical protein
MTTKAIIDSMTEFVNESIQKLDRIIDFWGDENLIDATARALPWPTLT